MRTKQQQPRKASRKRPSETPVLPKEEQEKPTRLRVRLKRFHAVASWTWNANDDVCGICQSAFEGTAPNVKYPGDECPVVWGKCGHAFHLQCVSTWLNSNRNTCPICRSEWEFGSNQAGQAANNNGNGSSSGGSDGDDAVYI